jgi:hypothetical protein
VDTDLDLTPPALVLPDARRTPDGAAPPDSLVVAAPDRTAAEPVPTADRSRGAAPVGDDQIRAAAALVRLGVATRVVIVNGIVDEVLPDDYEIRGTPVHLDRRGNGRALVTAGQRRTT